SFPAMSSPAVSFSPPTVAPLSSFTSATGTRSRRPYGSQNDHRYSAPYSSGSNRSETSAARGSLPLPNRLSSSVASFGARTGRLLVVVPCCAVGAVVLPRGHHHGAFGGLAAHRHHRGPGPGDRPQQRPCLGPFGIRELQVRVVHAEEAGAADQSQRDRQP